VEILSLSEADPTEPPVVSQPLDQLDVVDEAVVLGQHVEATSTLHGRRQLLSFGETVHRRHFGQDSDASLERHDGLLSVRKHRRGDDHGVEAVAQEPVEVRERFGAAHPRGAIRDVLGVHPVDGDSFHQPGLFGEAAEVGPATRADRSWTPTRAEDPDAQRFGH